MKKDLMMMDRWCQLAGIIQEQADIEDSGARGGKLKDLHVFDFDDTLGVTTSPTLVAAVEYNGGDPDDPNSYTPVTDLVSRVGSTVKGIKTPPGADLDAQGLSGDRVKSSDELNDSQAIVLDTEQYRDWKEKYVPAGNHVRLVINPNIDKDIFDAGRKMSKKGITGEIHVADYSPSSTIGTNVMPIQQMLKKLASEESAGNVTAVVTARKGETDLDALGGGKVKAQNASDMKQFISDEAGVTPDYVYGAADFSPTDPAAAKKDLILKLSSDEDVDNIHFYDDDPENAERVAQLCTDAPELSGKELDIYNYEFVKGKTASSPTKSCVIETKNAARSLINNSSLMGRKKKLMKITKRQLRRIVRESLEIVLNENKHKEV